MDIRNVGLPTKLVELLVEAGLETVEAVWGTEDLTGIAGIGAKSAAAIRAALPAETGSSHVAEAPDLQFYGNVIAGPTAPPTARWVAVRNDGPGPVVVGNTYLYPGEARKVRAAHAPAGLIIKEMPDDD